jgi:hypothetical protein
MSARYMTSMSQLASFIFPALDIADADAIVEIGAEHGGMSKLLVDRARRRGRGGINSIDPCPAPAFARWAATVAELRHVPRPSVHAIEAMGGVDAWLIDGDHNWYTVHRELELVHAVCTRDARPMLALLHDVSWPCARRDMYYAPKDIPEAYRQPYAYEAGCVLDETELQPFAGLYGTGFAWAERAGGPRNGVLTAVEDFLSERLEAGEDLGFARIPAILGLGVVFSLDAPWSAALADFLVPFHEHDALLRMERNRLENFLHAVQLMRS